MATVIGYGNLIDSATLAGTWTNTANLKTRYLSQKATATDGAYVDINLGSAKTIGVVGICANTVDSGVDYFAALGQSSNTRWSGLAKLGSDVYACVYGGDIYKQTGGTGNFVALGQTSRSWSGLQAVGSDLYACVYGGDIYKQTGGAGAFVALGQTSRNWYGLTALGTNVYACVYGGDIYMQTAGVGTFNALAQTARNWRGMTVAGGNVYCAAYGGDIYMQTAGTGTFNALAQTARNWTNMDSNGTDVYACVYAGAIYKQTAGTGTFTAINAESLLWNSVMVSGTSIYAGTQPTLPTYPGDLYKLTVGQAPGFSIWAGTTAGNTNVLRYGPYPVYSGNDYAIEIPDTTAQYWRIRLNGTGTIGRIFIGPKFQPTFSTDWSPSIQIESRTQVAESLGGQEYFDARTSRRVWRGHYSWLTDAEAYAWYAVQQAQDVSGEVYLIDDDTDTTYRGQRNFLGRLRTLDAIEWPYVSQHSVGLEISELL